MIISIRGTSGSGKSTLVKSIMGLYEECEPIFIEKRKRPYYYLLRSPGQLNLAIPGHYETPCGGCDTILKVDDVFGLVERLHDEGNHVLFEGVMLCNEVNRTVRLHNGGHKVAVMCLDTSLEDCLFGINMRRVERGDWEPVNPKHTAAKHGDCVRLCERLTQAGVPFYWKSRSDAFDFVIDQLKLDPAFKLL